MIFSDNKLGTMIRNGRKDKNLTQEQIAEKIDCNLSYYGCIERGENIPSLKLFIEIFRTLNLSADALLYPNSHISNDTYQRLIHILSQCTDRELAILLATAETLIQNRNDHPDK